MRKNLKATYPTYFPDRRLEDLQWNLDLIQIVETAELQLLFLFHTNEYLTLKKTTSKGAFFFPLKNTNK